MDEYSICSFTASTPYFDHYLFALFLSGKKMEGLFLRRLVKTLFIWTTEISALSKSKLLCGDHHRSYHVDCSHRDSVRYTKLFLWPQQPVQGLPRHLLENFKVSKSLTCQAPASRCTSGLLYHSWGASSIFFDRDVLLRWRLSLPTSRRSVVCAIV